MFSCFSSGHSLPESATAETSHPPAVSAVARLLMLTELGPRDQQLADVCQRNAHLHVAAAAQRHGFAQQDFDAHSLDFERQGDGFRCAAVAHVEGFQHLHVLRVAVQAVALCKCLFHAPHYPQVGAQHPRSRFPEFAESEA